MKSYIYLAKKWHIPEVEEVTQIIQERLSKLKTIIHKR